MIKVAEEKKNTLDPTHWIERYSDYLYSYAYARLRKEEVAQDLVQDTFFSALRAKETFLQNASEKTWLVAILKRKIIDYYRKKSTQNELNILDKPVEGEDGAIGYFFENQASQPGHWTSSASPNQWGRTFETSVESDEFNNILRTCLTKLPEKTAAAFVMKNMEGLETDEICKELNITQSNYWVMMHRAKLMLRDCMEKNWFNK
ncbi:MAG: sigma-70 family RNA polymerase sigma factor [Bacteroidetes bacterium]|nr:sigma-70 family RNA polymerase sigma factor [Bacteroidota bacterium]MBS1685671.1 sigma-70 family RNA polymerase sigma factor [Bacteroidota bacterium]